MRWPSGGRYLSPGAAESERALEVSGIADLAQLPSERPPARSLAVAFEIALQRLIEGYAEASGNGAGRIG